MPVPYLSEVYMGLVARLPYHRFAHLQPENLDEAEKAAVVELAREVLSQRHAPGTSLANGQASKNYLQAQLIGYLNEVFGVVFLDSRLCILSFEILFFGTINQTAIYPRVVVQRALELNAAAVIFAHNHPSGCTNPSREDIALTRRLMEILAIIDVRVVDHIVIATSGTASFAEQGLL